MKITPTGRHKNQIELNACILLVKKIEKEGFAYRHKPSNSVEKVKRCLGINLVQEEFKLTFPKVEVFEDNGQILLFNLNRVI